MRKAIATLLSLCVVFSIMAQGMIAYAQEPVESGSAETELLTDESAAENEILGGAEDAPEEDTEAAPEADEEAVPETGASQEEGEADSALTNQEQTEETAAEEAALLLEQEELAAEDSVVVSDTAGVELIVTAGLPIYRDVTLRVSLTGADGAVAQSQQLVLPAADGTAPAQAKVRFSQLPDGAYTLTVSGDGFASYTQTLTLEGLLYSLQLSTGRLSADTYSDAAHPGLLLMGDVNSDGVVDQSDVDDMIDALESEEPDVSTYDLDGSGAVDLLDLQMLAEGFEETEPVYSTVTVRIPETLTAVSLEDENTVATGSLDGLLTGDGSVTLATASAAPISEENPVNVTFQFGQTEEDSVEMGGLVVQTPAGSGNEITQATVTVECMDGTMLEIPVGAVSRARSSAGATVQADGSIVIDFGGQIAVKKVSIKITATANSTSLAEITQVEFLNDMESRIPEPEMDIPENLKVEVSTQSFSLSWDPAVNVTGYEVRISFNGESETVRTSSTSLTVSTFKGSKLENGETYTVQVQSLNGEWRSGYCDAISVVPKADKVPDAPDGLVLNGLFQRIEAKWTRAKNAESYNLYYRKAGDTDYIKVEGISSTSYTIQGLDNNTRYEVYVTGVNYLGEGAGSLASAATTANVNPVKMPAYGLINTTSAPGTVTDHIISATHSAGYMKDSPLDSGDTAWGVVDGDFASWYGLNDWDDGATYPDNGGVRVTFDDTYHIGRISLAQSEDRGTYGVVRVYAKNEAGQEYQVSNVSITKHSDGNGRIYYTIKIAGGVNTNYLRVCLGYSYWNSPVSIAEMRFYTYDSLEDDILALYADDLHMTLREDVDASTIQALRDRLNTPDEVSGELHPDYATLLRELDNAQDLLETTYQDAVSIHTQITTKKDGNLGITGLNAWQPLGVTAYAGEEIVVYVGGSSGKTGDTAPVQLIATQYNAEYGQVVSNPITLKIGRNEIMVPELVTFDAEHGGALYVQYTGTDASAQYSVRVSGGVQIPRLDLYGVEDAGERLALVTDYVQALETYAQNLEATHAQLHEGHDYNPQECVLNTTDVQLDLMMYSVPVTQLLAGLSGSTQEKAAQLLDSLDAMDQMMILFYQHKGLTDLEGAGTANALPSRHLNIRYMRMFSGAFMYAASNHIGIGWDSVVGLTEGQPIQLHEDGSYASGNFFGWGIAHEIGHNINQSSYAVAEVTNNYFSQISQASEGVRFGYEAVYEKVTSGTVGASSDVFTQLAMYWQLHLAYDTGYEYEIYDSYEQLISSRFFARVDTYARTTGAAPAPGGVALTLGSDANQNFMRLAAAAAEKDLTEFFTRWGLIPDETTAAYLAQFEPETRAIYYTNDDARTYGFTHDSGTTILGQSVLTDGTTAQVDAVTPNQVNLKLEANVDADLLLGYEIARITYENGQAVTEVVGFTTGDTYTDTVTTINNRTVTYQITAIDQFLNRSESITLPAVKISHDGSYDKSLWTVTTNMTSHEDTTPDAGDHDPCAPEQESAIVSVIDNDKGTTYTGTASEGEAVVTLNFHKTLAATGFKYTLTSGTPIGDYELQISTDGQQWTTVASGTFTEDEVNTVYFVNENNDPWVCTYDASQLRLVVKAPAGTEISISELDVLGPTGDNVELLTNGIGYLEESYSYADGEEIPAGSLVFTGSYKGNPAYNVVLLYDQDGNVVGGTDAEGNLVAQQIILAPDPGNGQLGEVSEGYWVYWIEPDQLENVALPESVRAELYRVDNATTNEGQRLTSDTLMVTLPESLPLIKLGGSN